MALGSCASDLPGATKKPVIPEMATPLSGIQQPQNGTIPAIVFARSKRGVVNPTEYSLTTLPLGQRKTVMRETRPPYLGSR
jgi:hypothetical protein